MLKETVFRGEDFPAADRFDAWRERMDSTHASMELSIDYAANCQVHHRKLELGPVSVWPVAYQPLKLSRRSDPEVCHLSLPTSGVLGIIRDDHEIEFHPLDIHPNDSSRPSEMRPLADGLRMHTGIGVEIPKALLPLPRRSLDRVIGRRLSGREGVGALLAEFVTRIARDSDSYQPADGPRLGTILIALTAALFAHALDTETTIPPETHHHTLTLRIKAFMQRNLHDPHLTPGRVAAAHHISTSYLHRLFQAETMAVASYIRRHRLEGARRDLADPALHTTPIHAIAARWGFPRAADFSRAFRTAYGTTPKDHRYQALQPRAEH